MTKDCLNSEGLFEAQIWGLWPLAALINHSCLPNLQEQYLGDWLALRACRPIAANEELTLCYTSAFQPRFLRQRHLKEHFGFECRCSRCEEEELPTQRAQATFPACAAEWNALLPRGSFRGVLRCESVGGGFDGAVALLWEAADFAKAATEAQAAGAVAAIFAAAEQERPFGYRHEETPPGIPCCMVGPALAAELLAALEMRKELQVEVRVLVQETAEEDRDVEEGLVSAFIANDAVESELHRRLQALRGERDRCERSLRFARQMRHLLERNEAHCPVCLAQGEEAEAFAVLPDCFHILCRACLEQQAGMGPSFACPMCRISVFRLDIVVFRAPGRRPAVVVPDGEAPSAESEALETEVPSKLERLLALLGQILADPEERVLVYTQWATHVVYLQKVLEQSGLPALALVGELRDTMDVLSRFGSAGAPRVLLLSSQRHSSGINLQMARHVVIVHPYCTPTATSQDSISRLQMLAFEAQAIGRVRRFPQKKAVHVHRLFAVGSVEEELYRRPREIPADS
ncbi:unnamed protein product [Effrenium voratum]|nr:unnamed protein product [Effrenium voratum]